MKVIDNQKYFSITDLEIILKNKCWKDDWGVETIYVNGFIELLEKIEIIEEDKPIEKLEVADYIQHEHREMIFKINELIDEVNELKESRGNE